jgi:drug/metabolite transporter superfamily protein YnfA
MEKLVIRMARLLPLGLGEWAGCFSFHHYLRKKKAYTELNLTNIAHAVLLLFTTTVTELSHCRK